MANAALMPMRQGLLMQRPLLALSAILFSGCFSGCLNSAAPPPFRPAPGQGQYVRPAYLNAVPTPRVPDTDACRSVFYRTLVGRHEGAIFIAGLPGRKRVIRPAFTEEFEEDFPLLPGDRPPFVEVQDLLPDQTLYAPSIRTVSDLSLLGEVDRERLTLMLDVDGYVQEVRCG